MAYQGRLDALATRIAETVKANAAIEASNMFTFDGSLAKGRRMTADLGRLMLRAYNAEADNAIRSLRLGNVVTAKNRLRPSKGREDCGKSEKASSCERERLQRNERT